MYKFAEILFNHSLSAHISYNYLFYSTVEVYVVIFIFYRRYGITENTERAPGEMIRFVRCQ